MSTYPLTPNGYAGAVGPGWRDFDGSTTVVATRCADGSDATGIWFSDDAASSWILGFTTKTIPDTEIAVTVKPTVRARRTLGSAIARATPCTFTAAGVVTPLPGYAVGVTLPIGAAFATSVGATSSPKELTQADVNNLALNLIVTQTPSASDLWLSEASLLLNTTSKIQSPVISSPSGSVTDTTRPTIEWTHVDRISYAVTGKAKTSGTCTVTIGTHVVVVGQKFAVQINDAAFDTSGATVTAVTSTTVSYVLGTGTQSSTSTTGTAWIGDDKPQDRVDVMVIAPAVYGAAGFTPDAAYADPTMTIETRTGTSIVTSLQTLTDLPNGSYRAYVRTRSYYGGLTFFSPWSFTGWTQALTPPTAPEVQVLWDEAGAFAKVTVQGLGNALTLNASSLESNDTTGWETVANVVISASTTQAKSGTHSLRMASAAGGDMSARTTTVPATAGRDYSASVQVRGASVRSVTVALQFLDVGGSVLSTVAGTAANDATGAWTLYKVESATAPADTVTRRVLVTVASTGGAAEYHYVDEAGTYPVATAPTWSPGTGGAGSTWSVVLERSLDSDATTWTPVTVPAADSAADAGGITITDDQWWSGDDYEAHRYAVEYYRVSVVAVVGGALIRSSAVTVTPVVTTAGQIWWLKAIEAPALNTASRNVAPDGWDESRDTLAETTPLASGGTFVTRHVAVSLEFDVTWVTDTAAEKEGLTALLEGPYRLLLQSLDADSSGVMRQMYVTAVGSVRRTPLVPTDGVWTIQAHLVEETT